MRQNLTKGSAVNRSQGPRILLLDIETAPILAHIWSLWQDGVNLEMMQSDWFILSWAAKWLNEKEVMYADQSRARNIEDDKKILQKLWNLLDEADIVITQNGIKFDHKKINARFIINGMKPPSPFKMVDTLVIAKKHFAFTSNKLEYLSNTLNKKFRKLTKERKFNGFELWKQCLAGNRDAWAEMKKYNVRDVYALEETFGVLAPWDSNVNRNLYTSNDSKLCCTNINCGSHNYVKRGFRFTASAKYQRYICLDCGTWFSGKDNLFTKAKKKSIGSLK